MQFSTEPKLIKTDLPLFRGLVSDLFPGLELQEIRYGLLEAAIDIEFVIKKLQFNPKQKEKVLQLYEAKIARHGVMLIGKSGGSKTTVYEILCGAMIRTFRAMVEANDPSKPYRNPYCALVKSVLDSGEVKSLTQIMKHCYNEQPGQEKTSDKNELIKAITYMRDQQKQAKDPQYKPNLKEPVYDESVATIHDKQFPVTIKFMNPKSLNLN